MGARHRKTNECGTARRILACPGVTWVPTKWEPVSSWLHMNPEALSSKLAFRGRGGGTIFGVEDIFRECLQGRHFLTFLEMLWPMQTSSVQLGKHGAWGWQERKAPGENLSGVGPG